MRKDREDCITKRVLQICKDYKWYYIIRYKSASSIVKEYRALPETEKVCADIEYQNEIMFKIFDVNLIYFKEKKIVNRDEKVIQFAWITSIKITKNNIEKIVSFSRNRRKIENQGFNRKEHWQGNIEHACS